MGASVMMVVVAASVAVLEFVAATGLDATEPVDSVGSTTSIASDVEVVVPRLSLSGRNRPPRCRVIDILLLIIKSGTLPPKSGKGFRVPALLGLATTTGRWGLDRRGLQTGLVIPGSDTKSIGKGIGPEFQN